MGKIKIKDLSEDPKISKNEMRKVLGGVLPLPLPDPSAYSYLQQQYSLGDYGSLPEPLPSPIRLRGVAPIPTP